MTGEEMRPALQAFLREMATKTFAWGEHDCARFALQWAERVSGRSAPELEIPGTCGGWLAASRSGMVVFGATEFLAGLGFLPVFEEPVSPMLGDIILLRPRDIYGVCTGRDVAGVAMKGVARIRVSDAGDMLLWRFNPDVI